MAPDRQPPQPGTPRGERSAVGVPIELQDTTNADDVATQSEPSRGSPPSLHEGPIQFAASGQIGQYELIRLLGRGGMGAVYLARDLRLGRLVAIKLLTSQRSNRKQQVLAEARITAQCSHENIVVIHEVGEVSGAGPHQGQPYLVLEYLEGQTLAAWLSRRASSVRRSRRGRWQRLRSPVVPGRAVEWMLPVVRALTYLHKRGITHRDLKPGNIMLTDTGTVKVLDFGIARARSSARREGTASAEGAEGVRPAATSGKMVGTLPYMSPEQINTHSIDHRTDLWSVGVILFEMVIGHHPTLATSHAELLQIADMRKPMLSAAEAMPTLGPLASIIDRCLIKDLEHRTPTARALLRELEALAPSRHAADSDDEHNPFVGLSAFQEADAERFFGRQDDIQRALALLRRRPMVAVVGPSGTGKSSLVRAGVIPALKRSGEGWDAYVVRPGRAPLAALAQVLLQAQSAQRSQRAGHAAASNPPPSSLSTQLSAEPGFFAARLRARAAERLRRAVLFVDQFEELYTQGVSATQRAAFLDCLAAAADDPTSPLRVILSMRSDFLDRLSQSGRLAERVTHGLLLLPPLDRAGLRQALLAPLTALNSKFESGALIDRMVDELDGRPSALPLLQFTAAALWEQRDRAQRVISAASFERVGGIAGALATHADAVLAAMSARDVRLARAMLLRLVTPERTRALDTLAELRQLGRSSDNAERVLALLIEARLLAVTGTADDGAAMGAAGASDSEPLSDIVDGTVELAHESLIDAWPTLHAWLEENQEDSAMLARLRSAARDWERAARAPGLLWTGATADEAELWRARYQGPLAPIEQQYLAAIRASTQHTRRLRRRLVGGALVVAAVITAAMSWLAWRQTEAREAAAAAAAQARQDAIRARDATRMATLRTLERDPTTQLALLREIEDIQSPPPGALSEARRLLHADVASALFSDHDEGVWMASFSPDGEQLVSVSEDETVQIRSIEQPGAARILGRHDEGVVSANFDPTGARVVSSSWDKTIRVWRVDGAGAPLRLYGHEDAVSSVSFDAAGERVVSASWDRTVRIWSADGAGTPLVLRGHADVVSSADFSPDGAQVVSGSYDKTVRIWSADGTGTPLVLRGHEDRVLAVSFSPDGEHIASASADKTVRIWRVDGVGTPLVLRGHEDRVLGVHFSPDGERVASAAADKTVRIWSTSGAGALAVLRGHDDVVYTVRFSPDGARVLSASHDKTVRLWPSDNVEEPLLLSGHTAATLSATFSPDGEYIASASYDHTVRVWRADGAGEPELVHKHSDGVSSVDFSPDGSALVSALFDHTARVWRRDGAGDDVVLRGHEDVLLSARFSPDGSRVVTTSRDHTVRVWRADGAGPAVVLRGHRGAVWWASFSPDGERVVSASYDKTVRVWSADGTGDSVVLRGHDGMVYSANFDPSGQRVVSASADKTVRVWRADGLGAPLVLRGHGDWVAWAEFSPDGVHIVSASKDKTIRIWRADGVGAPIALSGHQQWVNSARYSPDGARLVSASDDQTVRIWHDLDPISLDDPRLWTRTRYCMPVARRVELLGVTEERARRHRARCLERAAEAQRGR
ncbi:MAG: hypothetical protein Tsb0020_05610 [Haliangiales bacterium]